MAYNEIFSSFIGNLFKKSEEQIRFLSLTESMMVRLPTFFGDDVIKIDLQNNYAPLKPFLEIVKLNPPTDEIIDKAAYSMHRQILKSYLSCDIVEEREDIVVDEELHYEIERMNNTLVLLMRYLFHDDVIVLNAQYLSQEAINIIRNLESVHLDGRIIFCFDSIKVESSSKNVMDFFEEISNQKNFYDISNIENEDVVLSNYSEANVLTSDYDTLYNSLRNSRHFLALDQNLTLAEKIADKIDNFGFTSAQRRSINMELGLAYFSSERNDEATLFFNYVLEAQHDDMLNILALFYLSKTLLRKNDGGAALKYAILAEQHLKNNKSSKIYALVKMMIYLITERSYTEESVKNYKEVLKLLKKCNLVNNYIKTILVVPWDAISNLKYRKKTIEKIQEAYEIAQTNENLFMLSTACHWKGIVYSYLGDTAQGLDWYFRCNELRSKIGDLVSLMKIRNGLSYEALIRAEYDSAYDLINSFIARLDEINDYFEILNTLKNIAFSLFFVRHFEEAYELFQKIIHFIRLFSLQDNNYNTFAPEYNDMLIYKTYIELERGEISRAKINLLNTLHNGKPISPIEEVLVKLIEAIIAANERNLPYSEQLFSELEKRFFEVGIKQEHRLVFIYYEYAHCLNKLGHDDLSALYFKKGLHLAEEKKLSHYTQFNKNLTLKEYLDEKIQLEPIKINLVNIEEKAEKQKLVNQLHGTLHNYQFLNRIMSFASTTNNIYNFLENSLQSCFDYTMSDGFYVFEKNEDGWKTLASLVKKAEIKEPSREFLDEIINEKDLSKNAKLIFDEGLHAYYINLTKYEFTGCFVMFPNRMNPLDAEMINVLNIAFSNIQSQLVIFKQNEHLIYISSTDQLSMLKNRRALQEFLTLENERLLQYKIKRKFVVQETIAFMDLDNFKYYNDTFGHEAGDLFIKKFAELLRKVYRKTDFIARYGGDEFVVVLLDATCEEANEAGLRLYELLEEENYFIPELEEMYGKKIKIEKHKFINFSMGICSNYDLKETADLNEVMVKADHALYYSKQSGKGKIIIWNEVKDSIFESKK